MINICIIRAIQGLNWLVAGYLQPADVNQIVNVLQKQFTSKVNFYNLFSMNVTKYILPSYITIL